MTNETPLSVPTVWSAVYAELKGGDWDEDVKEVVDDQRDKQALAAIALKYAHDKIEELRGYGDDGALAVLKATYAWRGSIFLTPVDVMTMADNFALRYNDSETPIQDYLDEHCDGMPVGWLNEHGLRGIGSTVRRPADIWIDDENLPGVWVFNKPQGG